MRCAGGRHQRAGAGVFVEEGAGDRCPPCDRRIGDGCLAAPQPGDGVADLVQFQLGGAAAGVDAMGRRVVLQALKSLVTTSKTTTATDGPCSATPSTPSTTATSNPAAPCTPTSPCSCSPGEPTRRARDPEACLP